MHNVILTRRIHLLSCHLNCSSASIFNMELRLRSTVDEDEDRPPMKQIYDFLKEFATTEPELPTTTAMERLDNLASQAEADSIDAYTFLMRFWEILVPLAYQLPYNHPSQARMAQLIAAFAERGHDVGSDGVCRGCNGKSAFRY